MIKEISLRYAGIRSTFSGKIPLAGTGPFNLEVLAMDPANANFGMDSRHLVIAP